MTRPTATRRRARARRSRRSRSPTSQAFYKAHWNPAAMTLVVAGDVDADALEAKLDAALGAWKPAGAKHPRDRRRRRRLKVDAAAAARRSPGRGAVRRPHRPRRSRSQGPALLRVRGADARSAAASPAGSTRSCASSSASRTACARAWTGGSRRAVLDLDRDRHRGDRQGLAEDARRSSTISRRRRARGGAREVEAELDPRAARAVRDQRVDRRGVRRARAARPARRLVRALRRRDPQGHGEGRQGSVAKTADPVEARW